MNSHRVVLLATFARRLGQALAALLFVFWGMFFVAHAQEWFVSHAAAPPLRVWLAQTFHLVMTLGLGLMLWRDKLGAIVTVIGTVSFFSVIGMARFPAIALINLVPIALCVLSWTLDRSRAATAQV